MPENPALAGQFQRFSSRVYIASRRNKLRHHPRSSINIHQLLVIHHPSSNHPQSSTIMHNLLVLNTGNFREWSIITSNNHPSNPQQPIQQAYVKRTSKSSFITHHSIIHESSHDPLSSMEWCKGNHPQSRTFQVELLQHPAQWLNINNWVFLLPMTLVMDNSWLRLIFDEYQIGITLW